LCTDKDESIAKYSVLADDKNLFASKYRMYMPTEEELKAELSRSREQLEEQFLLASENGVMRFYQGVVSALQFHKNNSNKR